MKIAIQADGGTQIGMGHVMRTLVLAKELSKENEVFYICRVEDELFCKHYERFEAAKVNSLDELVNCEMIKSKYIQGIGKIISEGFKVILFNEERLTEEVKEIKADMLITDSYSVNDKYFEETKKTFNKTVYIDDINEHYFNVDFLINQNCDAEDLNYRVNSHTKLLLGVEYILLRDEFKSLPNKNVKNKVYDIMITVGGADPCQLTETILNYVSKMEYNFHVVIGPSFVDTSFIESFKTQNIKFYNNANMCEIMKNCDMAISACGSTLYELSACGIPTLGMIIADNQQGIANKLNSMGIIKILGWHNKIGKEDLMNNIDKLSNDYILRKSLSEKASKIVDGKGAERIAKILCKTI